MADPSIACLPPPSQRLARDFASDAAREAEETMKDHLAASLILAVGLGILVGYFLRRGTQ
jgi:hypothetical protein